MIYHCENFQSRISCILFWAKKEKSADLIRWTVRNLKNLKSCQISLVCVDQNISNLLLKIFTVVDHSIIYDQNFFQNFLKLKFADSIFLEYRATCTRPPYRRSRSYSIWEKQKEKLFPNKNLKLSYIVVLIYCWPTKFQVFIFLPFWKRERKFTHRSQCKNKWYGYLSWCLEKTISRTILSQGVVSLAPREGLRVCLFGLILAFGFGL